MIFLGHTENFVFEFLKKIYADAALFLEYVSMSSLGARNSRRTH